MASAAVLPPSHFSRLSCKEINVTRNVSISAFNIIFSSFSSSAVAVFFFPGFDFDSQERQEPLIFDRGHMLPTFGEGPSHAETFGRMTLTPCGILPWESVLNCGSVLAYKPCCLGVDSRRFWEVFACGHGQSSCRPQTSIGQLACFSWSCRDFSTAFCFEGSGQQNLDNVNLTYVELDWQFDTTIILKRTGRLDWPTESTFLWVHALCI